MFVCYFFVVIFPTDLMDAVIAYRSIMAAYGGIKDIGLPRSVWKTKSAASLLLENLGFHTNQINGKFEQCMENRIHLVMNSGHHFLVLNNPLQIVMSSLHSCEIWKQKTKTKRKTVLSWTKVYIWSYGQRTPYPVSGNPSVPSWGKEN